MRFGLVVFFFGFVGGLSVIVEGDLDALVYVRVDFLVGSFPGWVEDE